MFGYVNWYTTVRGGGGGRQDCSVENTALFLGGVKISLFVLAFLLVEEFNKRFPSAFT